jgi:LacI family transcriptional regulator
MRRFAGQTRAMRTKSKATLHDVATKAGVSTATVSRVLNYPKVVQPETRLRVEAAIRELEYTPNFGARVLAANRTNTIGAIVPTLENAIFARGLEAFQKKLSQSGITLLVASSSYRPEAEEEQVRALVSRGADAILLIGYDRNPSVYDYLRRNGTPYVIAWAFEDASPHASIGFDNRGAMAALMNEVLARGHREVGLITASREGNDRARNRWLGILDAMRSAGLSQDALAVVESNYSIEAGRQGLSALVNRTPRPTAILCGNDVLAAGALLEAQKLGFRVPEDLSITGFDDIEIAEIMSPPLTTVHVPHRRMGEMAAELLIDILAGHDDIRSQSIETEIMMRGTLGPAPGRS